MSDEEMTFDEWWASETEAARWESDFVEGYASERKYQLYAAAWCRGIWSFFPYDCCRHVVETLERVADGLCEESELEAAWDLFESLPGPDPHAGLSEAQSAAYSAAVTCVMDKENRLATVAEHYCKAALEASQNGPASGENIPNVSDEHSDLIRELTYNPSHPVALNSAWQTPTVVSLAQAAYDNRILPAGTLEPARLAVLADALEEAGCDNADVLNHLRQPGEHVRGCWVVDRLLGKA